MSDRPLAEAPGCTLIDPQDAAGCTLIDPQDENFILLHDERAVEGVRSWSCALTERVDEHFVLLNADRAADRTDQRGQTSCWRIESM